MELPISLDQHEYNILRKLAKYGVLRKDHEVTVVFTLPLVRDETLKVFRVYPIPDIRGEVGTFADLANELVLVDETFTRYVGISKSELAKCNQAGGKRFCADLNILKANKASCETAILRESFEAIKNRCKIRVVQIKEQVFIKTEDKNTYVVLSPNFQEGNLAFDGKLVPIKFNGTQLLKVKKTATLQTDTTEIRFYENNLKIMATYAVFPPLRIKFEAFNGSGEVTENFTKVIFNKEDFVSISRDAEILKSELENKLASKTQKTSWEWKHNVVAIVMAVIGLGLIIVALAVAYLFRYKLFNVIVREEQEPPEGEAQEEAQGEAQEG